MPTKKTMKKVTVRGYAVLQDEGDGLLPVAMVFGGREFLTSNIPRKKGRVEPCVLTYKVITNKAKSK